MADSHLLTDIRLILRRNELRPVYAVATAPRRVPKIGTRTDLATVDGREVTVVWMPYNWGFQGLSPGASVNYLTIDAVDPGAGTQETKACLVDLVKASQGGRA